MALGQRDLVENQFVRSPADRAAPPLLVFGAFLELDPVEPVAILLRDRLVGLFDPRAHFLEQRVDPALLPGHPRFEPGVLGLQVGEHGLVGDFRIAGIAQPGVVIADRDAVVGFDVRLFGGDGGCGQGHGAGLWWSHCPCKPDQENQC